MAEAVFSIQELCDELAYHIALEASSRDDLKSAALVCRTLCISAQSQIFRHVILDPALLPGAHMPWIGGINPTVPYAIAAFHRLLAAVTSSPHLLRFTRFLDVPVTVGMLEPLSTMRFPVLQTIRLVFGYTLLSAREEDIFHLARDFIGLPSIREVAVAGSLEMGLDLFGFLFEAYNPHLESLTFDQVLPLSALPTTDITRSNRVQIKKLKLSSIDSEPTSSTLPDWFISPSCPFDFTHLIDVTIDHDDYSTALPQVLTSARLTITALAIFGDFAFQIDLSEFPGLTYLEMDIETRRVISSLKSGNCVETLVFRASVSPTEIGSDSDMFSATDALLTNCPLPAIRRVEVRVLDISTVFVLESVNSYLPRLAARALLVATAHR
ncbi:hypothetical protein DFH09DRAFT_1283007 [Mycena vulgaris]|nr:hypothetical protein DFH09DRAFT_1283007 [Mycena vulgaris]